MLCSKLNNPKKNNTRTGDMISPLINEQNNQLAMILKIV